MLLRVSFVVCECLVGVCGGVCLLLFDSAKESVIQKV